MASNLEKNSPKAQQGTKRAAEEDPEGQAPKHQKVVIDLDADDAGTAAVDTTTDASKAKKKTKAKAKRQRAPRPPRPPRPCFTWPEPNSIIRVRKPCDRPEIPPTLVPHTGKGFLELPRLVRDQIYRHLLRSRAPIRVSTDWSEVPETARTRLDPAILETCRQIADEGAQVLYGENTFSYNMRDAPPPDEDLRSLSDLRYIYWTRHSHLLRTLEIVASPMCTGAEHCTRLAAAVRDIPKGAILDTLTLKLSPRRVIKDEVKVTIDVTQAPEPRKKYELQMGVEVAPATYRTTMIEFFDPEMTSGPVVALQRAPVRKLALVVYQGGLRHHGQIDTRFLAANVGRLALENNMSPEEKATKTAEVEAAVAGLAGRIEPLFDNEKRTTAVGQRWFTWRTVGAETAQYERLSVNKAMVGESSSMKRIRALFLEQAPPRGLEPDINPARKRRKTNAASGTET